MSNPYHKDYPITWEELHRNARALAWRLLDHGPWKASKANLSYSKALMVTVKDFYSLMILWIRVKQLPLCGPWYLRPPLPLCMLNQRVNLL